MPHRLVFYANRATAKVVSKGTKAKSKAGYGKVVRSRVATPAEEKQIRAGKWIRTRADGKKPSDAGAKSSTMKGRPKLKKRATKTTPKRTTKPRAAAKKTSKAKPVWKRKAPAGKAKKPLTPKQKASAKAAARRAGRPYPNLIDNIRAAAKKRKTKAGKK